VALENPHCGADGVPFMNNTTGFSTITLKSLIEIRLMAWSMADRASLVRKRTWNWDLVTWKDWRMGVYR
jgi:hypothetical protein